MRAELGGEEVPGHRVAALGVMTQAPSPYHSGLLSKFLSNSAPRGSQSDLPKARIVSLPCFKVLPRLSCDLKIKPKVLFMTYKIRHCVTGPWPGQTLPIPGPGQMELIKPCMCTSLCQEHSFIFPSLCPAHPPGLTLDTQLHPLIWHGSPASPPLGPQGPGSVAPPELLYLRILDTAICLGAFGGA